MFKPSEFILILWSSNKLRVYSAQHLFKVGIEQSETGQRKWKEGKVQCGRGGAEKSQYYLLFARHDKKTEIQMLQSSPPRTMLTISCLDFTITIQWQRHLEDKDMKQLLARVGQISPAVQYIPNILGSHIIFKYSNISSLSNVKLISLHVLILVLLCHEG